MLYAAACRRARQQKSRYWARRHTCCYSCCAQCCYVPYTASSSCCLSPSVCSCCVSCPLGAVQACLCSIFLLPSGTCPQRDWTTLHKLVMQISNMEHCLPCCLLREVSHLPGHISDFLQLLVLQKTLSPLTVAHADHMGTLQVALSPQPCTPMATCAQACQSPCTPLRGQDSPL